MGTNKGPKSTFPAVPTNITIDIKGPVLRDSIFQTLVSV